jgi:hypothetical protein
MMKRSKIVNKLRACVKIISRLSERFVSLNEV